MQSQGHRLSDKKRFELELSRFQKVALGGMTCPNPFITVRALDEWTIELAPREKVSAPSGLAGKRYGLTILGLVHGNEFAGLAVLNDVLDFVISMAVHLPFPMVLAVGNPWAGREGTRFLERDLNRIFGSSGGNTVEEKRARQLEPVLSESLFLLDLHQTTEHSDRPFFIFPFQPKGFAFANAIAPHLSTVTHWGDSFSTEGFCTDEYMNSKGGHGITLELGQAGFDPFLVGQGVHAAIRSISVASEVVLGLRRLEMPRREEFTGELFSWEAIVPYPEGNGVDLVPGWHNFKRIEAGQLMGHIDGKEILAPASGHVLFPKYRKPYDNVRKPTELCRIMKRLTLEDLPKT